jgi:hypothetical protein
MYNLINKKELLLQIIVDIILKIIITWKGVEGIFVLNILNI